MRFLTTDRDNAMTEAEWEAARSEEDYASLMRFVAGDVSVYEPGTNGELWGRIAKRLLADDPGLAEYERRIEFLDKVKAVWIRDHCVCVTLSEEEIAMCRMGTADPNDLPQA